MAETINVRLYKDSFEKFKSMKPEEKSLTDFFDEVLETYLKSLKLESEENFIQEKNSLDEEFKVFVKNQLEELKNETAKTNELIEGCVNDNIQVISVEDEIVNILYKGRLTYLVPVEIAMFMNLLDEDLVFLLRHLNHPEIYLTGLNALYKVLNMGRRFTNEQLKRIEAEARKEHNRLYPQAKNSEGET